jgi:hypothetical protein
MKNRQNKLEIFMVLVGYLHADFEIFRKFFGSIAV